jgi:predicted site-specific integrase-resolvase
MGALDRKIAWRSCRDMAYLLGVSPRTLARWTDQGRVPATYDALGRGRGRIVRYDPVVVKACLRRSWRPPARG